MLGDPFWLYFRLLYFIPRAIGSGLSVKFYL